ARGQPGARVQAALGGPAAGPLRQAVAGAGVRRDDARAIRRRCWWRPWWCGGRGGRGCWGCLGGRGALVARVGLRARWWGYGGAAGRRVLTRSGVLLCHACPYSPRARALAAS